MKTNLTDDTPLFPGTCEWCGKPCESEDVACSLSCEAQIRRLEAVQGRIVLRILKTWRIAPNHAARNAAVSQVQALTDKFLSTDNKRRERAAAARRRAAQEKAAKDAEEAAKAAAAPAPEPVPQSAAPVEAGQPEDRPTEASE